MKNGQKKNALKFSFVAGAAFAGMVYGASSVKIENVAQRWPWNNKVDITYSITDGQDVSAEKYYRLVFTANIDGVPYTIDGVHDVGASAATGTNTVTWTAPSGIKTDNFSVSAAMYSAEVPSGNDYMIIDLASGEITYEGLLASQSKSNERYAGDDDYKENKLVLRKVPAGGTYRTGHSDFSRYNSPKDWKTDRDFYMGIFPVTRAQYIKMGFVDPGANDTPREDSPLKFRPVARVSWNDLRTAIEPSDTIPLSADTQSGTFFQRLNCLTGNKFAFDLPTEVMSEIVERAGATTKYPWGDTISQDYANYFTAKRNDATYALPVDAKDPNAWGVYDTVGNVREFCLDDASLKNMADAVDPWTPADAENDFLGSSRRMYANYGVSNSMAGDSFRVSYRQEGKTNNSYSHMAPSETPDKQEWVYGFRVSYIVK